MPWGYSPAAWTLVLVLIGVLAFLVRLMFLVRGGGLHSIGNYDDGVYYSAAAALVHGRLPYRSFLFLQPPAITVALSPFAWLGWLTSDACAFEVGRVFCMAVGAVNAVLVAVVLRPRGLRAAVVGGLCYALFWPGAYAEHSTLLEPFATLGVLCALAVLVRPRLAARPRWCVFAGVVLGLAVSFKVLYVLPVVLVVAFNYRKWRPLVAGAVVAVTVVCLPFFVAAPRSMFREVIVDQLGRPRTIPDTAGRLRAALGVRPGDFTFVSATAVTVVVAILIGLAVAYGVAVPAVRLYAAMFVSSLAFLLASPSFYLHYVALTALPMALLVGCAAGALAGLPSRHAEQVAAVAAVVALIATLNWPGDHKHVGQKTPAHELQHAASRVPGCITSDDPTILIEMDVLSRDLSRGCTLWPDVTGWTYDADSDTHNGVAVLRSDSAKWQEHLMSYLESGQATIAVRFTTGISPASERVLKSTPVIARFGPFVLRMSTSGPAIAGG